MRLLLDISIQYRHLYSKNKNKNLKQRNIKQVQAMSQMSKLKMRQKDQRAEILLLKLWYRFLCGNKVKYKMYLYAIIVKHYFWNECDYEPAANN